METKVVVARESMGDNNEYMSISMDDWSDAEGIGLEGMIKLHDGSSVCYFYYSATDDESFQKSLDFLSGLQDSFNVAYRELQMAYIDAKIRRASEEEERKTTDVSEQETEAD